MNEQQLLYAHKKELERELSYDPAYRQKIRSLLTYFFNEHRFELLYMLFLFVCVTLCDMGFILVSRLYGKNTQAATVPNILILIACIIGYVAISYAFFRAEKNLIFSYINRVKISWINEFFAQSGPSANNTVKASIIAKITYQVGLLQMGIRNTLSGLLRLVLFLGATCLAFYLFEPAFLKMFLVYIPLLLLLLMVGYFISRFYLIREATLSSSIIRSVAHATYEYETIRMQQREAQHIRTISSLLDLDRVFRTRRELWSDVSTKVLFALVVFFLILLSLYRNTLTYYFSQFDKEGLGSFVIVLGAYLLRNGYMAFKVGMYAAPLRIGLTIGIPEKNRRIMYMHAERYFSFVFRTNSVKLPSFTAHQSLEYNLPSGIQKHLTLPLKDIPYIIQLFAGKLPHTQGKSWIVKQDGRRIGYNTWKKFFLSRFIADPHLSSDMFVGEYLLKKGRQDISSHDIPSLLKEAQGIPLLEQLFAHEGVIKKKLSALSLEDRFLIQLFYCILHKPHLIIIPLYEPGTEAVCASLSAHLPLQSAIICIHPKL